MSSGGPTATFGTDVLPLLAQGNGTAFELVLGKRTSDMNSLSSYQRLFCLSVEITAHCDYCLLKFSYLLTFSY